MKIKKGEITTQQIVLLIILLVSFIVILFFLFRLNPGKQSESEVCHNSVVMKGTSAIPSDAVPLKCSRKYICLTSDGSCEKMTKPEIKKVKTEEEVYNVLAEEMADCWWTFGEGKINYVSPTWTKNNYCSICSQIGFDNSLNNIKNQDEEIVFSNGQINKDYLYYYLARTKMPDKDITYSQYILKTNDIDSLMSELTKNATKEVSFGTIDIGEQYFIVMGITSNVNTISWVLGGAALGGVAAVVTIATAGLGMPFLVVAVGEIGVGVAGAGAAKVSDLISPKIGAIIVEGEGVKNKFMVPTIQKANSEEFNALNCEEILTTT